MRVLLDENVPIDLAAAIAGHEVESVAGLGWAGVKNGELLRRMADRFDALLTMDGNLEFQQPIDRQPFGVVLMQARSNRMVDVLPLVPEILRALDGLKPGELRKVRRRP